MSDNTGLIVYSPKQLELIKKTVAADCNNDEFNLFIEVARTRQLDPFRKQIYAVVYSKDDPNRRKMSLITSIDGYRAVAARNRDYRPDDDAPVFTTDDALICPANPRGIEKVTVKCWKLGPDRQWYKVAGEAYWDEFVPLKEDAEDFDWIETGETWPDTGKPKKRKVPKGVITRVPEGKWQTMPHVMLAKCAEAQALRRGWPEDLSGVYVAEEMDRAMVADISASDAVEAYEQDKRLMLTKSKDSIFAVFEIGDPLQAIPLGQFADRAAEYVTKAESLGDVAGWEDMNRVALKEFWARSPSDALELKKVIEKRKEALAGAMQAAE